MSNIYQIPKLPLGYDLETKAILKQVIKAKSKLSELKGVAATIPNEAILISSLTLQEAKDSSEIENIVTTQDDLYKAELNIQKQFITAATKEVLNYREAIQLGFNLVRKDKALSNNRIIQIQECLEQNKAGFRILPGTTLKSNDGSIVYTPPQDANQIVDYMNNLESFINDDNMCDCDPLIKMAIIHHQFESIHPFYDGNGRTGRIISVLYLITNGLLDLPILYLSRYITHNKGEYYRLIQAIRDKSGDNSKEWEEWIMFILTAVEQTSEETIHLVKGISQLMNKYKGILRPLFGKQYKHELLNNLFFHPYTKIEFMEKDMMVQRNAATKYLNEIVKQGLLEKIKIGRENYYINIELMNLFLNHSNIETSVSTIESITE
ncbi:MAG TPA: Fic family protein [Bacteroidales bacterium]|jgi:Fic family protein|nr:Fic family protein [Bacteroidales bacterium]HPT52396.1 Fic family protein [Bacteroidales bacterium]